MWIKMVKYYRLKIPINGQEETFYAVGVHYIITFFLQFSNLLSLFWSVGSIQRISFYFRLVGYATSQDILLVVKNSRLIWLVGEIHRHLVLVGEKTWRHSTDLSSILLNLFMYSNIVHSSSGRLDRCFTSSDWLIYQFPWHDISLVG